MTPKNIEDNDQMTNSEPAPSDSQTVVNGLPYQVVVRVNEILEALRSQPVDEIVSTPVEVPIPSSIQEAFETDTEEAIQRIKRSVEERQNVDQALDHIDRLVADMRHTQGEIDVLKTDTRRILAKLVAE